MKAYHMYIQNPPMPAATTFLMSLDSLRLPGMAKVMFLPLVVGKVWPWDLFIVMA